MSFADFKLIGLNRFPTSLYMWGDNTNGLLGDNRTPNYFSWSKISSGGLHTVAIRSDGLLFVWGRNTEFQLGDTTTVHRSSPVQIGTSSWNAVSAGLSHTVAIKGDSTLWAWGGNRYGQLGLGDTANRSSPVQVGTTIYYTSVSAGGNHTLAINVNNSIWTWGFNGSGQLGDNTIVSKSSPVQVTTAPPFANSNAYSVYNSSGVTNYLSVPSNSAFDLGTGDFTIECWFNTSTVATTQVLIDRWNFGGGNAFLIRLLTDQVQAYAIAAGTTVNSGAVRIVVNTWYHVAFVRTGTTFTLYLNGVSVGTPVTDSGSIAGTSVVGIGGHATEGLVGYISNVRIVKGTAVYTSAFTPSTTPLTAITNTVLLMAQNTTIVDNSTNAFTITNVGSLTTSTNTPFKNVFLTYANLSVSGGKSHSVMIATDNTLYAWGDNTYGELGDGTTINRSSPVQIGTSSWSQVSAGGTHTVGIESDGSLMAWGYNNYGQLGLNTPYSGSYWTQVSEGPTHTLAIRNDGALFVWGRNQLGQLGTGDTINRSSPVQLGTSSWISVDAGSSHSVAVRSDGKLFTWGSNDWGQLGNNLNVTVVNYNIAWSKIVISSSSTHTIAIKNDGTLWAWGLGTSGQLGDSTIVSKSSPIQIGALNTWIDVAAGSVHSMGITNDSVLYTWGSNTFGQLGDGTVTAKSSPIVIGFDYKKVFAGYQTSIAIDNNNLTYIWGDNTNGIIPGGVIGVHRSNIALLNSDNNWSSFAIDQHILGIRTDGTLWSWGLGTTGQLGLGDLISRSSPVQVGTSSWSQVSTGLSFNVGITTDNSLYAWGLNSNGQLGLGDTLNRNSPVTVGAAAGLSDSNAYAINFTAGYVTFPSVSVGTVYTVELWFNVTSFASVIYFFGPSARTSSVLNVRLNNATTVQVDAYIASASTFTVPTMSTNTWYHLAVVRNASNLTTVFLNGVRSSTGTTTIATAYSAFNLIGGTNVSGNNGFAAIGFPGYISNFRFVNGSNVYDPTVTSISVPVNSLTAITNTSILTAQYMPIADTSGNSLTITTIGSLISSQNTPFGSAIATGSTIATQVVAGAAHTLMLNSASNLYTWGLDSVGQLGDTATVNRSSPVQVGTDTYNFILSGTSHSIAIRSTDSALFAWGLGTSGQLGDTTIVNKSSPVQISTTLANQSSPVQIGNSSYTVVSAGEGHTLSLGSDGILYGWGKNDQGQIGGQLNTLGIGWSKVVIGPTHSLGIRFDGTLYAWGNNASGQLGDRTTVAKSSPVVIDAVNNWKDIAVGQGTQQFSMAIRTDGKLYAWGNNQGGQLGWISWRQISSGGGHSLLLRSDGALYTMGFNGQGQLGDATTVNKSSPVLIGSSSWSVISAGISTSAAIDSVGRLFTWGYNNVGQLGLATTANRSSPVQVTSGSWSQVAIKDYALAINSQGSIWSWGNNNNGQLGLGTTVNSKVPLLLDGTTTSYSVGFNGVNDYLSITNNSALQFSTVNFTFECWVYFNTFFTTSSALLSKWSANVGWELYYSGSVNKFAFYINAAEYLRGTTTPTVGTWYHLAVTRSSGTVRLFVNGVIEASATGNTTDFNDSLTLYVGSELGTTLFLNGYLSNIRIVKGQALYTSKFTPTTSPLTTTSQGISTGTVSLLTAQNATIIDNSSNGFTITQAGTPAVTPHNPFSGISSTGSTSWTTVSTGLNSLAIRSNGTLYTWGDNTYGQLGDSTTVSKSSPIQIAGSWSLITSSYTGHNLATKIDSSLFAWGRNTYGELGINNEFINLSSPTQIGTLSYTNISTGNNYSLALALNGNNNVLYGWGLNDYNQLNNINAFVWNSIQSTAGIQSSIGSTVGKLYLWGDNTYGQLGDSTRAARSSPTQLGGFYGSATYKQIITTPLNTAILSSDNTLYMMGDNTYGQLGQGDTISRSALTQVGNAGEWSSIAISGTGHAIAISRNGVLFAWGNNTYNELGQSDLVVVNRSSPVNIGTNGIWTKVSAGNNYSIAIDNVGYIYAWGRNDYGQAGSAIPLSYTSIGAGVASRNDGKLYTWGDNSSGQIGDGTTANRSAPTQISTTTLTSTSWSVVAGSNNNRAGIKVDGTLWVWGDNRYGQLGIYNTAYRSSPVQVGVDIGITSWSQVFVTPSNIFAIRASDNTLWGWGDNSYGQLGQNDTVSQSSPVQIAGNKTWSTVAVAGTGHVLAIRNDGTLWTWGNNQYNELGYNQRIQIAYSSPVQVGTSSWTKVSAGNNNSFAIRSDSTLWGWGRNEYGQIGTNNNTPLSWTQVAGGDSYSVALRSDGKLFGWGRNDKGQLGLGHTVNKSAPTQIAVSNNYNYYSTSFNGTTDSLSIAANASFVFSGDFTIEGWMYFTNTAIGTPQSLIGMKSSTSWFDIRWVVNKWQISLNATTGTDIGTGPAPTNNSWVHVACVRSGSSINLYVNGVSTGTVLTNSSSLGYNSVVLGIGADAAAPSNLMTGYISNVRIVNGQALYTGNFPPSTTPLTTISQGAISSNVVLLTCQNNIFIDNSTESVKTITQIGTGITTSTLTPFYTNSSNYSWTQVSATLSHTVAIRNDGTLWAWGANNSGQLGTGDTTTRSAPIQIGTSTDNSWSVVAAGSDSSFAIRNDRALFGWGDNTNGILGQSNTTSVSSPIAISSGTSWNNISARQHILATTNLGTMYAWGLNNAGQLGMVNVPPTNSATGDTVNRSAPVQISGSWNLVAAGNSFSMATSSAGTLFTWGLGTSGQLGGAGNGTTVAYGNTSRSSPSQIGASSWSVIAAGTSWAMGISIATGPRLYHWGGSANYENGAGTTLLRSSPVQIGASNWTTIGGTTNPIGIITAGTLFAWGTQAAGQVGIGDTALRSSPVQIASLTNLVLDNVSSPTQIGTSSWTQIAAGDLFTNALRAVDGGLFTWGYGINGRLGSGATPNRSSPVQVGTSSWIAVSTGGTENTVALTIAYTLFSWGRNNVGQVGDGTTVDKSAPTAVGSVANQMTDIVKSVTQIGTSSWSQVSAGDFHVYATRSDSGLFSWGKNDQGQLGQSIATTIHRSSPVQIGTSSYTQISAGYSFGAAITTIGTLYTTGLNNNGQQGAGTVVGRSAFTLVATSSWTAVNAGASSMIGTTISNTTFVWGTNTSGQLGLGDTANRSAPTQLGNSLVASMYQTVYPSPVVVSTFTSASWTQISTGGAFSTGIDNSGRLYAWGNNAQGQLGDGTTVNTMPTKSSPSQIATTASSFTFINTSSPVQVSAGTSWNTIAAGGTHTVAIKSDGTLWSWGTNIYGQTGNGGTIAQYIPKQVDTLNSFISVAAGTDFSIAINKDYTLWRWGYNASTDISSPHRSNALQIGSDSWNFVSAGGNTVATINSLGKLYGWGKITTDDGFAFNLAINPITWATSSSYTSVNAGDSFIHALDVNYGLWGYGLNVNGQLGDNTTVTRSSPVQLGSLYSWSILGGGIGATPLHAGALYLAGLNTSGQLGLGDTAYRSSPVQLPATNQPLFNFPVRIGISRWTAISAGYSHSMAIRDDNTLWGWGLNVSGQVGDTSVVSRSSPVQIGTSSWIAISAGKDHTSGIKLDNTLWTWGLNTRGQLGDSTTTNRSSPVQVAGYWNNVSVGASHTTALAENNTLYVWGDDNFGQ